jgi:methylmalonyl-CoA epimerase
LASTLHHVGVIVPDEEQMRNLMALLGLKEGRRYYIAEYEAECVFTEGSGGVIEFILPRGGKLAKFNKGMGGLHHIALQVDNLEKASEELKAKGVELLESQPVTAGPIRINFLPPIYTRGIIVEYVEPIQPGPSRNED